MRIHIISNTLWSIEQRFKNTLQGKIAGGFSNLFVPVAVFWFLIRVLPKPSRITYPCQRATLSLLFAKVAIVMSSATSIVTGLFKRKGIKIVCFCMLVGTIIAEPVELMYYQTRYSVLGLGNKNLTLANISVGFPVNRVVRVHGGSATNWDFSTGYYWQYVDQSVVDQMVEEGVKALTGASTSQDAWQAILSDYVPGDIVGIKVNGNDMPGFANDQRLINTLPQVINAVIKGLKAFGVPESDIWVIEPTGESNGRRRFYSYFYTIINGLYPGVSLLDGDDISFGGDASLLVNFPYAASQYITDQMAQIDHLINIVIMKAITTYWGITGAIKSMQGNIQYQINLHSYLARTTPDNPDVLIYQNPHILGKTRLIVGDGIFGLWNGVHMGADDIPDPWRTFGNGAPNCIFFSTDPVAIDCIMLDHINVERSDRDFSTLPDPQLIAGAAAGLGIREHGPPYSNIDYIEIEIGGPPPPIHDVAVIDVSCSPTAVVEGELVQVDVTVKNEGNTAETFAVRAYYDSILIDTQTGITLSAGASTTVTFTWDTTGVSEGTYTIKAEVPPVAGETDSADNEYVNGTVTVTLSTHTLSVSSSPITGISFTVDGVSHLTPWSGSLTEGSHTIVMPSSVTDAGETYKFKNWEDSSTTRTRTISLVEDKSITAYYEKVTTPPPGPSPSPSPPSPANGTLEVHAYCGSTEINSTVEVAGFGTYTTPFTLELEIETYTLNATYNEQSQTKTAEVAEEAVTQVEFHFADTIKPTAHAGLDQTVNEDTAMKFDGSGSSDNIGIVGYAWTFMDVTPQTLTSVNPTYTFATPGVYTATLKVRDAAGNYATDTTLITVLDVTAPIADAGDNQTVTEGTPVNFNANSSSDNIDIVTYEWDFGDGTYETGETVTHTYTGPGNYTVTLTVKDAAGNSETDSINITVLGDTDKDGTPDITDMDDDGDGMPDAAAPNRWISSAVVPVGIAALVAIAAIATLYITKVKKASSHTSPTRSSST